MKEMQIDLHFHLRLILMLENPVIVFFVAFFHVELKFLIKNF